MSEYRVKISLTIEELNLLDSILRNSYRFTVVETEAGFEKIRQGQELAKVIFDQLHEGL